MKRFAMPSAYGEGRTIHESSLQQWVSIVFQQCRAFVGENQDSRIPLTAY
ncbi:MAG: hypothetical protein GY757_03255 [bacterium]|nr:hypothetical protein [bacterium]